MPNQVRQLRSILTVLLVAAWLLISGAHFATSQTVPPPPPQTTPTPPRDPQKQPSPGEEEIDPADVVRVKTTLVNSPVLVIGRDGKYVPSLRREDFAVFEDGIKQDVAYFAPVNKPFTVALLIDTSRSAKFKLPDIQAAAASFVDEMRPDDQALVITFGSDIKVLAEATASRESLRRALGSIRPGGGSRVYDAIDFTIKRLAGIEGRKALIILSDGVDTASTEATFESSFRSVATSDALVYPVQFNTFGDLREKTTRKRRLAPEGSGFSKADYARADSYLHQIAAGTGTALYPAYDTSDLGRAVGSIVEELHNEYSVGYYPRSAGEPGQVRRVEIKVNQPQLVVRARTGYVIDQTGAVAPAPRVVQADASAFSEAAFAPVPRSFDREKLPVGARWVCEGPTVPGDFVVVKEGYSFHCPPSGRAYDDTNAWFIRKPGPLETMCKGFMMWRGDEIAGAPIPTGYVVLSELESPTCAKSSDPESIGNAWAIKIPTGRETICKGFVIPRGFAVIGEKYSAACPTKPIYKNAWLIERKL